MDIGFGLPAALCLAIALLSLSCMIRGVPTREVVLIPKSAQSRQSIAIPNGSGMGGLAMILALAIMKYADTMISVQTII